jgi:anti-anti-sigma factor
MTAHTLNQVEKTLTITVPGDLLSTNYDAVGAELNDIFTSAEVKKAAWDCLVFDLRHARLIDSMGLNLIVSVLNQMKNRAIRVRVQITSRTIHRTFLFTRLERHMEIEFEDSAELTG